MHGALLVSNRADLVGTPIFSERCPSKKGCRSWSEIPALTSYHSNARAVSQPEQVRYSRFRFFVLTVTSCPRQTLRRTQMWWDDKSRSSTCRPNTSPHRRPFPPLSQIERATARLRNFIALHLNNHCESPWYRQLDLGGSSTSGLARRASLRTMQESIKRFLNQTKVLQRKSLQFAAQTVLDFWAAVAIVLRQAWENPRRPPHQQRGGLLRLNGNCRRPLLRGLGLVL